MKSKRLLLTLGLGTAALNAAAQMPIQGVHYPVGLEGIKGGDMPPPGLRVRDDNLFYVGGYTAQPSFDTFMYLQAPEVGWTSGWKILGARYGADIMVPLAYKQITDSSLIKYTGQTTPGGSAAPVVVSQNASRFGVGDIKLEPVLLSWELKQIDFMVGYALWVPSADFDEASTVNLGDGRWTHMVTLGVVWYPDKEKTWAFSVLNHYEFNCRQVGTTTTVPITPGGGFNDLLTTYYNIHSSVYSLEWGVSKTIGNGMDLGLVGYYQKQYTDGTIANVEYQNSEVAGIGPEFDLNITRWDMTAKFRYACEYANYHHPEGNTIDLEIEKRF